MSAKGRALWIVLAIVAIFASSPAFASIPRSTILDAPSIGFRDLEIVDYTSTINEAIDNAALLHHAIDAALIAPAPVESLSETRVWVSRLERPLFVEPVPLLSDGLQKASADVWPEIASGPTVLTPDPKGYIDSSNLYAFAGGDPVNARDPEGKGAEPARRLPLPERPPLRLVPPLSPQPAPVKGPGAAGPVGVALIGYELINKAAEYIEFKADEYVEAQLQERNRIKVDAAKRRNSGRVVPHRSTSVATEPAPQSDAGTDCGNTPTLILKYRIHGDAIEFIRQLAGQESGFRQMTAGQIKANIEAYRAAGGRPPVANRAAEAARRISPAEAAGRSALHNPDPCVGGDATLVEDFGNSPENSSIGAQNRWKIQRIYDYVSRLRPDSRVDIRLIAG